MKIFRLKLQEYKRKIEDTIRKIRRNYMVFKIKLRTVFANCVSKMERKLGLEQRCSLCPDKLFCEEYSYRSCKKGFFQVDRCCVKHSDK